MVKSKIIQDKQLIKFLNDRSWALSDSHEVAYDDRKLNPVYSLETCTLYQSTQQTLLKIFSHQKEKLPNSG